MRRVPSQHLRAFSLTELLVVIAVIAIVIALLLPTLGAARRAANTLSCAANLRAIAHAMQIYASQNRDFIVGGPNTTGLPLFHPPYSNANCPGISQIWDYQAPLAKLMGIRFEEGASVAQRIDRFTSLIRHRAFRCRQNDILATAFTGAGGPNFPTTLWISYSTSSIFHYLNSASAPAWYTTGQGRAPTFYDPPPDYMPTLKRIGDPSRKIFLAEGGRFIAPSGASMDLAHRGSFGGSYADPGAWSKFSRAWPRGNAPGNGGGGFDLRLYSFRHGTQLHNAPADRYRLNVAFFDGHVETLGDLELSNPDLWAPKGASLLASDAYPDVHLRYFAGRGSPYRVP